MGRQDILAAAVCAAQGYYLPQHRGNKVVGVKSSDWWQLYVRQSLRSSQCLGWTGGCHLFVLHVICVWIDLLLSRSKLKPVSRFSHSHLTSRKFPLRVTSTWHIRSVWDIHLGSQCPSTTSICDIRCIRDVNLGRPSWRSVCSVPFPNGCLFSRWIFQMGLIF